MAWQDDKSMYENDDGVTLPRSIIKPPPSVRRENIKPIPGWKQKEWEDYLNNGGTKLPKPDDRSKKRK